MKIVIRLIINLYNIENEERLKEIEFCLDKNLANHRIKEIVVVDEGFQHQELLRHSKIIRIKATNRVKFSDLFKYLGESRINIIANNDVWFDSSLRWLSLLFIGTGDLLALTRIEKDNAHFRAVFGDSQDAWIFKGQPWALQRCTFYLGLPGCDGRLNYIFHECGHRVLNPSKLIKVKHEHQSSVRNYNEVHRLNGMYLYSKPIGLLAFHFYRSILYLLWKGKIQIRKRNELISNS
jgi:hypothetical protein